MELIIIGLAIVLTPYIIRKFMLKIFWFLRFLFARRNDDYVPVKNEWLIK
jgi:hypothetical protein